MGTYVEGVPKKVYLAKYLNRHSSKSMSDQTVLFNYAFLAIFLVHTLCRTPIVMIKEF